MRHSTRRAGRSLLFAAGILTLALFPAGAAAAAASTAPAKAVVVAPQRLDPLSAGKLQARLERAGAEVYVIVMPGTALAAVDADGAARLRRAGFAVLRAGHRPSGLDAQARTALRLLRELRSPAERSAPVTSGGPATSAPGPSSLGRDVLHPTPTALPWPATAPTDDPSSPTPLPTETTVFAQGSVAVSIIFTESNGEIDEDLEDWGNEDPLYPGVDRKTLFTDKILSALAWWAARSPGAGLTFVIPAPGVLGAPMTADIPYEPNTRSAANDGVWRDYIMGGLGFTGGHVDDPPPELGYGDAVRAAAGTDWAFTVYVVDTLNDYSGMIYDAVAYTWSLYGPYMAVGYDCDGYTTANADAVVAHELGHVFGALDEYDAGPDYPSWGDLSSGYLWVANGNAVRGGTANVPCIMRGGQQEIDAFAAGALCPSTKGQTGLRDGDADGLADVVDTAPSVAVAPFTVQDGSAALTGVVAEVACPHGGPQESQYFPVIDRDISVSIPHDVRFRVDGGAWTAATATDADGLFDQWSEPFSVITPTLADGHHLLEVEAATGGAVTLERHIWLGATPVTLALRAGNYALRTGEQTTLRLRTTGDGFPVPYVPDISLSIEGGETTTVSTDDTGTWTADVAPVHNTIWRVRFAGSGQFLPAPRNDAVFVGVYADLTARRDRAVPRGETMHIWGTLRPAQRTGMLVLERLDKEGQWEFLKWGRSDARGRYLFAYTPKRLGVHKLRVEFLGSALNLGTAAELRPFRVR